MFANLLVDRVAGASVDREFKVETRIVSELNVLMVRQDHQLKSMDENRKTTSMVLTYLRLVFSNTLANE